MKSYIYRYNKVNSQRYKKVTLTGSKKVLKSYKNIGKRKLWKSYTYRHIKVTIIGIEKLCL